MSLQSFEVQSDPSQGPARLAALREWLAASGHAAVLVPRADRHQGEYVAPGDERLAWLTGFTGSAGFAAITATEAGVFIDGRYRVQVRDQVADVFTPVPWPETKLADWLKARVEGRTVAYDPWLHTQAEVEILTEAGLTLVPVGNPIDPLWPDRAGAPARPLTDWPEALAGATRKEKIDRIAASLNGAAAVALTLPDSIMWLLNVRGSDVPRNPLALAFALIHADGRCDLFLHPSQHRDLGPRVTCHATDDFLPALAALDGPVRLDPKTAPAILFTTAGDVRRGPDPCLLPKARKTDAEIAATTEAHLRDGAAMARFLAWLDAEAPTGNLTEIAVVRALETFRRETNALRDISFDTICGAGAHGAIVHYRVTEATDAPVRPGELLLVDSGGQYEDGTTDVTRTVAVGPVPDGAAEAFTRVLQGMIAISRLRFPKGLAGVHLDAIARMPLWLAGQDYDHGTGHGVGVYLSVHEGPAGLSRRSDVPFEPGMIVSNEPGYYREGHWGIRIENLIVVEEAPPLGDPRPMLSFRTLTWVPIDRRLIRVDRLSPDERAWLDAYHAGVFDRIGPRVDAATRDWLNAACAPLQG